VHSRKVTLPLRLSNEKQGTSFSVSLLSLGVLLKVSADHWCLGCVPSLEGRTISVEVKKTHRWR